MSKYILVVGDVIDFTDKNKIIHRGIIVEHKRDGELDMYRVKFDSGWAEYPGTWVSAEDCHLVFNSKGTTTANYSFNSTKIDESTYGKENIKLNKESELKVSSVTIGKYPSSEYYLTSDDFFELLRVAYDDTYGSKSKCHPEDLYVNVLSVLEVVSNTLINILNLKSGKPLEGIKDNEI